MGDEVDLPAPEAAAVKYLRESIATIGRRLRTMAERVEAEAMQVVHLAEQDSGRSYTEAAQTVVHELAWQTANLNTGQLIRAAANCDRIRTEAPKRVLIKTDIKPALTEFPTSSKIFADRADLWATADGGNTWTSVPTGVPSAWRSGVSVHGERMWRSGPYVIFGPRPNSAVASFFRLERTGFNLGVFDRAMDAQDAAAKNAMGSDLRYAS